MGRIYSFLTGLILAGPLLLPAVVSGVGAHPHAWQSQEYPSGFRIERNSWENPVEPGQSIQIENLHGDVRVRRNEVPRLDVFVVVQLQEQDSLRADVQIIETDAGFKVDVRYVAKDPEGESTDGSELIRRVDMVAYIPSGSPLQVRTDDDLIEAREIKSDIVAESKGGDLTIITEGSVRARTVSGSILSVLLLDDPERSSLLETESGDITVQIPDNLNIPGAGPHEVIVQVGTGMHHASVESKTGNVEIRAWRRSGQGGEGRDAGGAMS